MTVPLSHGLVARRSGPLSGTARVPGDKSVSHRAVMLGGLAIGETVVHGLLEGEDVLATAAAMAALGATVTTPDAPGAPWRICGVGVGGLAEPACVLDLGNSGTSARLLSGLLATAPIFSVLTGDASLTRRPMRRVTEPLSRMGAEFLTRSGDRLPMAIKGAPLPVPIDYVLPVASAQVKSAVLLAGLNTPGETTVIERTPTRDHSERMLRQFGAEIRCEPADDGGEAITIAGHPELAGRTVRVPGDISSAAFPLVAAAIVPGSEVVLQGVGLNPRRTGLIACLEEMGADLTVTPDPGAEDEPVGTLTVRGGPLVGIDVPPERTPSMIDEYPVLMVAAACAAGTTRMAGIGELRVKESDRIATMAAGLAACGVKLEVEPDAMVIHGTGRPPAGGATVATALDHRIAMSFLVLGLVADAPVAVDDAAPIATSFPGFVELMGGLGADLSAPSVPSASAAGPGGAP
ncbi:MAG: 3-phosphoshikimate 1-carboxyvinyltransferase [Rhodospirillaceae bacterium]|nr:3-phosphoshikimate 1-carboxyvinyltransferase [Rhodospirillaceae bacterium]MCA8931038.1 3-phosphoshikimate 1-carboxyvinyltransferase [Rhodospirillaceae bacterium]